MGQSMRLAANQAVQDTLQNSKQASLTSEAHENLKADLSMRQERAQEQEVSSRQAPSLETIKSGFCCSNVSPYTDNLVNRAEVQD